MFTARQSACNSHIFETERDIYTIKVKLQHINRALLFCFQILELISFGYFLECFHVVSSEIFLSSKTSDCYQGISLVLSNYNIINYTNEF